MHMLSFSQSAVVFAILAALRSRSGNSSCRRVLTAEGFESNFSTNYLSRFALTTRLRRGIGAALLSAAECVAAKTRSRTLWLTTYRHLPWNAPFYEKAGFVTVPVEECGTEILVELLFQRRLLPKPDERVAMRKTLSAPN